MKTFTPDWVLCAVGHGDLGRDPAWPLSWKTPCLCLNVSAQMSGIWSWGGFLWVIVLFSEWGSMALPGVSVEVGLLVFPSDKFTFPGVHRDTSGRLPGCCSVSESCLTLCDPMDCSTPGFPGLHYLLVFAQTHVHWVDDAIQLSHPLLFQLSILLSSRVFSNESILRTRWSKYWSFSFSISPSKEYLGLIYMYTSNSWGRSPF